MRLYLDSSALVKLVQVELESRALSRYLRNHRDDSRATSALARVEVVRALDDGGPIARAHARRVLDRLFLIDVSRELLDDAAELGPAILLRSLDAIHLASARQIGADLRAIVTYDRRMAAAANGLGFVVESPS